MMKNISKITKQLIHGQNEILIAKIPIINRYEYV